MKPAGIYGKRRGTPHTPPPSCEVGITGGRRQPGVFTRGERANQYNKAVIDLCSLRGLPPYMGGYERVCGPLRCTSHQLRVLVELKIR